MRVGEKKPSAVGMDALLDFSVAVALGDDKLTAAEVRQLLASSGGLVRLRGQWVELDRERLREVLAHWERVRRQADEGGLSFLEGMRLLAGRRPDRGRCRRAGGARGLVARRGRRLARAHARRGCAGRPGWRRPTPAPTFAARCGPIRRSAWRGWPSPRRCASGVCLADDMGLGKTIQVLALLLLHKRRARGGDPPHLLVVPASLLANWQAEIERFAPSLRRSSRIPPPCRRASWPSSAAPISAAPTSSSRPTGRWRASRRCRSREWSLAILDEAQAIKNPGARQTRAVKALKARARIALTGTPVENRLGDLWSIFDFLDPGLLGSAREFSAFAKRLADRPDESYAPLRRLIQPYLLRRLKTDRSVVADLPDKTEVKAFCLLSGPQAALYQQTVDELARAIAGLTQGIERRGLVLAYLMRFKQICNHPAHWLGEGAWDEAGSGKLARLRELVEAIAAQAGEGARVHAVPRDHRAAGGVPRRACSAAPGSCSTAARRSGRAAGSCERFQEDATVPFFVLSLKAGGTGLNLTAASHVVHFDRWWNPAVEDQATDRAFRIGQHRNVLVHKLVCRGTVEERIDRLIEDKQAMVRGVLEGGGEALLTEMSDEELMAMVALDLRRATAEA